MKLLNLLEQRIVAAATLLVLLAACEGYYLSVEHALAGTYGFSLDDSWIHATFARNLLDGHGWSFNIGEQISASTAPLYTALLALGFAITGNMVWAGKIIGMLGLAASAGFVYLGVEALTTPPYPPVNGGETKAPPPAPPSELGGSRIAAWLAAGLIVTSPALLWASLSGMESTTQLALVCAALYMFATARYRWMIALLALAVWTRPESVMLLGLGWLAIPQREKLRTLAIGTAILLPYFGMNYALGGYPFPLTVKTKSLLYVQHFSALFLSETKSLFVDANFLPIYLLLPFGIIALWKRAWWIVLAPGLFFVMMWSRASTTSSFGRYLFPLLPLVYLLIGAGLGWLVIRNVRWTAMLALLALVLVAGQAVEAQKKAYLHGLSVQNIDAMQVRLAKVIPRILDPEESVATNDVGALGYFGRRYVLDLVGLVTPHKLMDENIREQQPALVAIFDSWFPPQLRPPSFNDHYIPIVKISLDQNVVCGDSIMTVYAREDRKETIVERWKQITPDSQ
ncbi:hypothetical protein HZB60_09365 [candidate division KSB1 bacterium]|nr:hypothetical protein [candidate division KSB1 bacterium]